MGSKTMARWESKRLGEICKGIRGVSYAPEMLRELRAKDTVTLLRSTNIQNGAVDLGSIQIVPERIVSDEQVARKGDLLVCMSNGSKRLVGKSAMFSIKDGYRYTVGAFCSIFRPAPEVEPRFLEAIFHGREYQAAIDVALSGSAINNLQNSQVESIVVPFPPLPQQRRIAEILDTVDACIRGTEQVIAKLQAAKQGLVHDLLTRGVDEHGELRKPREVAPELYRETEVGWVPRGWEVKKIRDFCTLGRGRVISQGYLRENAGIYPVYSSQSADDGIFGHIRTFDFDGEYVTWTTDGANAGTVFYRSGKFNCTNVCGTLKAKNELDMRFLACALSAVSKKHVSYVGNPKLMNGVMGEIILAIPDDCHEQRHAMDCVSTHDLRLSSESTALAKLHHLKQSLMSDLLTGQMRVNAQT